MCPIYFSNLLINVCKSFVFKLNPPTRYPSIIDDCFKKSMLSLLALPPYIIVLLGRIFFMLVKASSISSIVGMIPVPIDHIGS